MAMMLGRYRTPGCCPGAREGRPGPDCRGGHRVGTRAAKRMEQRMEQRMVAREVRQSGKLVRQGG